MATVDAVTTENEEAKDKPQDQMVVGTETGLSVQHVSCHVGTLL